MDKWTQQFKIQNDNKHSENITVQTSKQHGEESYLRSKATIYKKFRYTKQIRGLFLSCDEGGGGESNPGIYCIYL